MKVSYSWLKEHLPLDLSAKDLAEHLLRIGFEVASIERRGPAFSGVVAAEILAIEKHPNADRLSLCTVSDGRERLSVVCGAKNIAVGQKVPLAKIGASLPGGRSIERSKIRGVESHGMLCSSEELGLSGANGGIWILDPQAVLGQDLSGQAGPADEVLDVEVTPNRPDCLSHRGLARELSAYFRLPLKAPAVPAAPAAEGDCWPIELAAPQACLRYAGRVLSSLKVAPSPGWLASRLEAVGLRPINNLVDVTNYLLMDIGQPLHVFDLDTLDGGKIVVRFAAAGERIKALDGKDYALSPEILVIADAKRPAAIAGVMGGAESAVSDKTTRAFLESAHFHPPVVRRASQRLRLRSDSSYRFERGTDLAAVDEASARAASLILSLASSGARASKPASAGLPRIDRPAVVTTARRVNEILGAGFPEPAIEGALKSIAASFEKQGEALRFEAPSWRSDLQTPWDLAEEAARLLGYDNIPAKASPIAPRPARLTRHQALAEGLRRRLPGYGLCEAYNYDFLSEKDLSASRLDPKGPWARLANPLSEDWTILRPSLLPGLLRNAVSNLNRGAGAVRLFELGKSYALAHGGVEERSRAAGLLLGAASEPFWKPGRLPDADFHDAKGLVQDLLSGVEGLSWSSFVPGRSASDPLFLPSTSLRLETAKGALGAVGLLHPQAARAWELERRTVCLFDLDLEVLAELSSNPPEFKPYSLFPSSSRDLSLLVDKSRRWAELEALIRGLGLAELKRLDLVDVFEGKGVPAAKRSLTVRLTFGRDDRTLKDAEVNQAVAAVLAVLTKNAGAVLRS